MFPEPYRLARLRRFYKALRDVAKRRNVFGDYVNLGELRRGINYCKELMTGARRAEREIMERMGQRILGRKAP